MDVACPKCKASVALDAREIAAKSRLESALCPRCGERFDAREALAAARPKRADVATEKTKDGEMLSANEASELLQRELRVNDPKIWKVEEFLKKTPEKIGEYKIVKEISRGGMGIVYKAVDPLLKREVAIKVLLAAGGASEEDLRRFQREAQAAARLRHPNIVPIYAVGTHEGQPYYVMDFVEGRTARELQKDGKMTPRLALAIIQGVAEALHHAHQHGVVHRDVKPPNIIVSSAERPQLTDFGLARRVDEDLEVTKSGTTMGTPSYMPPEQAEGRLAEVDAQSDVYSAGACLYDLLTGRPPFTGLSTASILRKISEDTAVPPRKLNPKIHRDVETICLKCLEKNKRNRYASAAQLADDIRRFNAGEAIMARPLSPAVRFWRAGLRHWYAMLAAAFMIVMGLAVLGYAVLNERERAENERANRAAALHDALQKGNDALGRAENRQAALASLRGTNPEVWEQARKLLSDARDTLDQAKGLAPENPDVKAALERLKNGERDLEVRRYLSKARAFLYPPQEKPDDPVLPPNYAGAEFAAQEALDRDPKNAEAREIWRVAAGIRKVSIQTSGPPNDLISGAATVYRRRVLDGEGRQVSGGGNEPGELLGRTPLDAREFEAGLYILTFQRQNLPQQQATLAVTRDARDEDLAFKFTLNYEEKNMVEIPEGNVRIPEGDVFRVKAFAIDRFEFPNEAGALPTAGYTLLEAKAQCAAAGKLLCTSAQWMRACSGDEQRRYPYGMNFIAGYCATGFDAETQKQPMRSGYFARCRTPEGIYDMSGNVAEWAETEREDDLFGGDYTSTLKFADLESSCRARAVEKEIAKSRRGFRCCKELK